MTGTGHRHHILRLMQNADTVCRAVRQHTRMGRVGSSIMIFCIIAALAIVHEKSIFGFSPGKESVVNNAGPVVNTEKGEVINTTGLGRSILGYGGTVPLEIYVTSGRIDSIKALPNNETENVFRRLYDGGLMTAWDGKTLEEAAALDVDGVTGATFSSNAVIGNVRAGIAYASGVKAKRSGGDFNIGFLVALLVVISGAILPLFIHNNPRYRLIQQALNVAILGFWVGVFIDYAMMLNFFGNGFSFSLAGITTVALLIVGLLYPVFNKPGHYCAWICPFGSLQEMAGKIQKRKIRLSPRVLKTLDAFRYVLWVTLLTLLFIGWGYQWIDYEIFTGFLVRSASWIVICVGVAFVGLSVFVNRPFCRFVCPTGTLLKNI